MARRPRLVLRLALVAIAAGLALLLAEVALRMLPPPAERQLPGQLSYQDPDGNTITLVEGIQRGSIVPVPPNQTPRQRFTWAKNASFYLCYSDHEELQREWFDEQGRVFVHINQYGLRERNEITHDKPAGQQRILCIGDSFTFGWGVPVEQGWVRLLEDRLRAGGRNIRTINCGAAGALVVDEYQWAVEQRFAAFEPDVVLLTICLNDLIPCSGLFVQPPPIDTGSKLLDRILAATRSSPLELDAQVDWVDLLLALPRESGEEGGLYNRTNPFEAMWSQGAPQRALAALQTWCDERKIKLMVTLWPFLQGLGPGRHYPFEKLHELVAGECERLGIPFHDVLPALRNTTSEELWVTPADMHANPRAHALAVPSIHEFVRRASGLF
ncbi:MAG: SGNH/GDSL hydrolase family protein [bacterium]|nr:SGNH/GDSL hydrolase family protein [bacterium]